jgi:hypothetical protein
MSIFVDDEIAGSGRNKRVIDTEIIKIKEIVRIKNLFLNMPWYNIIKTY